MRKESHGAIWGVLMIVGGILLAGKILHWFEFNLFFRGWWTLFLIIPSAVNFLTGHKSRSSALKELTVGVLLLMAAQGFIEYRMFFPLMAAALLVISGFRMMASGGTKKNEKRRRQKAWRQEERSEERTWEEYRREDYRQNRGNAAAEKEAQQNYRYEDAARCDYEDEYDEYREMQEDSFAWNAYANREEYRRKDDEKTQADEKYTENIYGAHSGKDTRCACTAIFMGKEIDYSGEVFEGAVLSSVMGAIDLDLSKAILYRDVTIEAITVMGGIDIITPKDVRVIVQRTPVLGGIDIHVSRNPNLAADAPTIYVKATCVLGGIDIF